MVLGLWKEPLSMGSRHFLPRGGPWLPPGHILCCASVLLPLRVGPETAALTSLGSLAEMQNLRPHPRPTQPEPAFYYHP